MNPMYLIFGFGAVIMIIVVLMAIVAFSKPADHAIHWFCANCGYMNTGGICTRCHELRSRVQL